MLTFPEWEMFFEQVANRGKLIFALRRVDVIRNGHQANIMVREKFFRQLSDLNVVSPQAGQVFDKDGGGFSLFQLADHFYKTRAVHRHTGNAVIQEVNQVFLFRANLLLAALCE